MKKCCVVILLVFMSCSSPRKESINYKDTVHDDLVNSLKQKIANDPANSSARVAFGELLLERKEYDAAIAQFDSALFYQPTMVKAKFGKANAYYFKGDTYDGLYGYLQLLDQPESEEFVRDISERIESPFTIRQLTSGSRDHINAKYSFTDDEIVYQGNNGGNWEIYRMSLADLKPLRLTYEDGDDESPGFSLDNQEIIFTSTRHHDRVGQKGGHFRDIYTMKAKDGIGVKRLLASQSDDWHPTFSHNNKWVVFSSDRADQRKLKYSELQSDLFIYRFRDSKVKRLTQGFGDKSSPSVSPDGESIVYVNNVNGDFEIYEQNHKETYGRRLVWGEGPKGGPEYSPDGKEIVYFARIEKNYDLYLYDHTSKESKRLTSSPGRDMIPYFSNSGKKVLFSSNRTGTYQIYEMDLTQTVSRSELGERLSKLIVSLKGNTN